MRKLALSMACSSLLLLCSYHAYAYMGGFGIPSLPGSGFWNTLMPLDFDFVMPVYDLTFNVPAATGSLKSPAVKKAVCNQVRYYQNKTSFSNVVFACSDSGTDTLSLNIKLYRFNKITNNTVANCTLYPHGTDYQNRVWDPYKGVVYGKYRVNRLKVGSQLRIVAISGSQSTTNTKYFTVPSEIANLGCTGTCDNPTCTWS